MKVYLVQESNVDNHHVHGAYLSKEKAQAIVDKDNAIYDRYHKQYSKWAERQSKALDNHTTCLDVDDWDAGIEFLRIWREANPSPERPKMLSILDRLYVCELEVEE